MGGWELGFLLSSPMIAVVIHLLVNGEALSCVINVVHHDDLLSDDCFIVAITSHVGTGNKPVNISVNVPVKASVNTPVHASVNTPVN